jgi:hypothetical protein
MLAASNAVLDEERDPRNRLQIVGALIRVNRDTANPSAIGPMIELEEAVRIVIQSSGRDTGRRLEEKLRALPCASSAIAPKLVEIGEIFEVPDGFDAQPNTRFCEWNVELKARLPVGTKVYVIEPGQQVVDALAVKDGGSHV